MKDKKLGWRTFETPPPNSLDSILVYFEDQDGVYWISPCGWWDNKLIDWVGIFEANDANPLLWRPIPPPRDHMIAKAALHCPLEIATDDEMERFLYRRRHGVDMPAPMPKFKAMEGDSIVFEFDSEDERQQWIDSAMKWRDGTMVEQWARKAIDD